MRADLRSLMWALALCASASASTLSQAQESYPARTVRFVVPFPAATPVDMLARIAAQKLGDSWRAPVIVEIRDGASGTIGVNQVTRAAPDGYTLLFTNDLPIGIAPAISNTAYDPRKDLAPLGVVAEGISVLVVHPSLNAGTLGELIALARAKPATLTFATSGVASTSHMCAELLKRSAGVDLVAVPYKGAAPAIQAVLAGEVSMYCSPTFQALAHIRSGKVKALGTTGTAPSAVLPDVMPIAAQGFPDVALFTWYGAFAPANTPPAVLNRIRDSLQRVFEDRDVRQKLGAVALDPVWLDASAVTSRIAADLEKWAHIAQQTGIRVQ